MKLQTISLKKFKNFKDKKVSFGDTVWIYGPNGSGKTTLTLEAVLFCLYGYTSKEKLSDLPTRNVAKSCTVEAELLKSDKSYRIIRKYPTYLAIYQDNQQLKFNNSREAQKFIDEVFGDRTTFMKFRIIDKSIGSNFLEEGQTALKKILFSYSDEIFNNMRKVLTDIKHEREIYNKNTASIASHYPSELRKDTLEIGIQSQQSKLNEHQETLNKIEKEYLTINSSKSKLKSDISYWDNKLNQIKKNNICYACKRGLSEEIQKQMIEDMETKIEEFEIQLQKIIPNLETIQKTLDKDKKINIQLRDRIYKFKNLINILDKRIEQKSYKYTNKDVEIVKQAIKELDNISSQYIVESLKSLEPIINNIINKIDFKVSFTINDKGKFTISLQKKNIEYNYKDLSTGQRILLQIAFKLALLMQKGEEGLIIADEGMGSLSDENLLYVLDFFKALPFQLILVSHRTLDLPNNIRQICLGD